MFQLHTLDNTNIRPILEMLLKPQDSFGGFDKKKFLIFRKYTKPSESTIKPTENYFEWHVRMQ